MRVRPDKEWRCRKYVPIAGAIRKETDKRRWRWRKLASGGAARAIALNSMSTIELARVTLGAGCD